METLYIRNVAAMDFDYVYTEQQTSYDGIDWEVVAEWKHVRDESSVRMANEWCSTPPRQIAIPVGVESGDITHPAIARAKGGRS